MGLRQYIAAAALIAPAFVCAQDTIVSAQNDQPTTSAWTPFGDGMLRYDRTTDIPRPVDPNIDRLFGRVRAGVLYDPIPTLQIGGAIKLAAADNPNKDDRSYNENERSNDIAIDQLFVRWKPSETTSVLLGKSIFPLELSPMVWDADLRPVGVSADTSVAVNSFDRLQFTVGYFNGNLPYGDDSRIGAVQAAYRWHEGQSTSGAVIVSYMDFSNLDQLTLQGLTRANRRIGTQLISAYRLLDTQFVARMHPWELPLEARIDLLRNLGANDQRDGARGSIVLGDRRQPHGWELGFSAQRIQRDAAMGAFNSDDWWFHSWARGVMPWIGYGIDSTWSMRLAEFHERRDGVSQYTDRILLDLYAQW
ncbi:MAG: putative porin [Rudaea sp.]